MKKQILGFMGVLVLGVAVSGRLAQAGELLAQARADFDYQMDAYRDTHADFVLKRAQFEAADSFANQEALVTSSKTMLLARKEVWWTYWQAVRIEMLEEDGLEAEIKTRLVGDVERVQGYLKLYGDELFQKDSREDLLSLAVELNDKDQEYSDMSYQISAELLYGRFTYAIEQLKAFSTLLRSSIEVQIRDQQVRQVKVRGLDEVDAVLNRLSEQAEELNSLTHKESYLDRIGLFKELIDKATPMFTDLNRSVKLLREMSKGMEF
jgi:hypothetical protein